jgi:pyridoxal phosphate enzyme (YggS family)
MSSIGENLAAVEGRIADACARAGRVRSDVQLIAVSKTFPAASVREASAAGQLVFGESRWQEAAPKIEELSNSLSWHFIGGIQRNKVRKILPLFDVIHAVDSMKLAAYMDQVSCELNLRREIFLQVNLAGESSKGGFDPVELQQDFEELVQLKQLNIKGLMIIPPEDQDARGWFAGLRELRDRLAGMSGFDIPWLSMGMSGDYEAAILEGATHVRVGSAIFGGRSYRVDGELG